MKNKISLMLVCLLFPFLGIAQEVYVQPDMADTFRSEGKIYVVIWRIV